MNKSLVAIVAAILLLATACGAGEADETATTTTTAADSRETSEDSTTTTEVSEDDGTDDGDQVASETLGSGILARTLQGGDVARSARFEGRFTVIGSETSDLPGELSFGFSGAYDSETESSELQIDFGDLAAMAAQSGEVDAAELELFAAFFEDPMQIITIGDTAWINWSFLALLTGSEGAWLESDAQDSGSFTAEFGFSGSGDPTRMLDELADADARVTEIGTEEVRGVPTTHYRAVLDTEAMAAGMTPAERAEFEAELGAGPVSEFPIDLWIDGDGLLRKYRIDLSDPAVLAESDGELAGGEIVYEIYDYGADIVISPPPADQIVTEAELGFDPSALTGG